MRHRPVGKQFPLSADFRHGRSVALALPHVIRKFRAQRCLRVSIMKPTADIAAMGHNPTFIDADTHERADRPRGKDGSVSSGTYHA